MNKKELSEIRKNFSDTSDLFVLNQVATAFVDSEKNIRCQTSRAYHNIASEESDCLMATLKRVLAGTLGKGLLEYEFPKEAYEEGEEACGGGRGLWRGGGGAGCRERGGFPQLVIGIVRCLLDEKCGMSSHD